MTPTALLKLGPADAGRDLSEEDYLAAEYEPGHKYELIRGRLEVSPLPGVPQDCAEQWLFRHLLAYSLCHPHVINHVTNKACVRIIEAAEVSLPEPDISAYRDFPLLEPEGVDWRDLSPVLVAEIISPGYAAKDLRRNPPLYLSQRSIQEYWVVDTRPGLRAAELVVHRRQTRALADHHDPLRREVRDAPSPRLRVGCRPLAAPAHGGSEMTTALRLGKAQHGQRLTWEEFLDADHERGHNYETIHGRLYVSPQPRFSADDLKEWLVDLLKAYARLRPDVFNHVSGSGAVEILSPDDPGKDLIRNPPLYLSVPSIKEYWVVDPRPDPYQPSMVVHRRHRAAWRIIDVAFGGTYTTRLLPGFTLRLDPNVEE